MLKYRFLLFSFFVCFMWANLFGQNVLKKRVALDREVYLRIPQLRATKMAELAKFASIERFKEDSKYIYLYVSPQNYKKLLNLGVNVEILVPPSMEHFPKMANDVGELSSWDVYPTYSEYLQLMENFATNYPDLFKVDTIGTTVENRLLLAGKLSDNVQENENEIRFFYSSSMHGDELTGYVLMLRLIDYLLSNYSTSDEVKALLDTMEIYINPLANPDGTYHTGDSSVYGAMRYNANNIDLNRNFPDPDDGWNPDGNETQKETQAMVDYMQKMHFTMAVNFHGGAEVVNYPWDTFSKRHADDAWFQYISHIYADTVHLYSSGYMDGFDNGITNGFDWYTISGGRQDFSNYYAHCKEITIELSTTKLPDASELPAFWDYNYRSFLALARQATYGVKGFVKDAETAEPLAADIYVANYDFDNSNVRTNEKGFFVRPLKAGTYDLVAVAAGYAPDTVYQVLVDDFSLCDVDFELNKSTTGIQNREAGIYYYPNPVKDYIKIVSENELIKNVEIYSLSGNLLARKVYSGQKELFLDFSEYKSGVYVISVVSDCFVFRSKLIKN